MSKVINLDRRFLVFILSVVLGIGAAIFFLHQYDQAQKRKILREHFEYLDKSPVIAKIKNVLSGVDFADTTALNQLKGLTNQIPNDAFDFSCQEIIKETSKGYLMIPCYQSGLNNQIEFYEVEMMAESSARLIATLKTSGVDPAKVAFESIGKTGNIIFYPIEINGDRSIFMGMYYHFQN